MKTPLIDTLSLEYILSTITSDDSKNSLLDVLYFNDTNIDKTALVEFIRKSLTPIVDTDLDKIITLLDENHDVYTYFLIKLQEKLISQITNDLGKNIDAFSITSIEHFVFWSMYVVAIKKCIGTEYAKETISPPQYFSLIPNTLNKYQIQTHNECIDSFNMDINCFSLKNTPDLRIFLHSFHSKNKSIKTRKKNLRRVQKRAKKIMQVNKLAHGGKSKAMFSNGKYLVPEQFANAIVKLYLIK